MTRLALLASITMIFFGAPASAEMKREAPLVLKDREFHTRGSFIAYAQPWSTFVDLEADRKSPRLKLGKDFSDSISIFRSTYPNNTTLKHRWPEERAKTGVYGYNSISYGNYDGGIPERTVIPRQVKRIATLRETFSLTLIGQVDGFNGLNEFYLTGGAGLAGNKVVEIGFFLHSPPTLPAFINRGTSIGSYVDSSRRTWRVSKTGSFVTFTPPDWSDVLAGSIDLKAALRFLIEKGEITGDEWFNGLALGVEPVRGSGAMTIRQWTVTYN